MHAKLIAGMTASLLTCGIAWAQQPSPAMDPMSATTALSQFSKLDKDRDDHISRKEAAGSPALEKFFDDIDTNKDGKISREEARAFETAHGKEFSEKTVAKFNAADKDGDGALTMEEAKAGNMTAIVKHFKKVDTNKDSKVSMGELKAASNDIKRQVDQ